MLMSKYQNAGPPAATKLNKELEVFKYILPCLFCYHRFHSAFLDRVTSFTMADETIWSHAILRYWNRNLYIFCCVVLAWNCMYPNVTKHPRSWNLSTGVGGDNYANTIICQTEGRWNSILGENVSNHIMPGALLYSWKSVLFCSLFWLH